MSQEEKGEVEYVDAECCHMCFSTERKLTSLDGVVDIYLLIVGLSPDCGGSVKEVRSCWECRAVLQRILKFRRQVQWARDILFTADALILDSDTCMSKLKCTAIEKINLKTELNLDTVRDVIVEIAPKHIENVYEYPYYDDTKSSSDRNSNHGDFVEEDDNEQHIEDNNQTEENECICPVNTPLDADPLAMEIKEEDDFDEGDIFDTEPACDQNQTNIDDEQAISNIKTNVIKSSNLISNINSVEKNDLSQNSNCSPVKTFISSTVIDNPSEGLTKTKQLVVVIEPLTFSKHNLTLRGEKVTKFNYKDKFDNNVIATQPPEEQANRKKINMVESMKPQRNIHNIPSTSLQPVNIKQLDKIQSNLMTVKNVSPIQNESQRQILHHATAAQDSQIDCKFVKIAPLPERVLSNIPSTSLQPVNIKQLNEIQSNLMTVKNISPLQDESQKQILHHATAAQHAQQPSHHHVGTKRWLLPIKNKNKTTAAQHSQKHCTFVKIAPLPERVLSNIPSTSLQPVNIKQLDEIQSNLMTVKNISPTQDESQNQILHHATTSQHLQIDCKSVKIAPLPERVLSNIPSTSLQPVNIKQLDEIQSNLMTVKNISPLQDESQKQILHHATTAQHSQQPSHHHVGAKRWLLPIKNKNKTTAAQHSQKHCTFVKIAPLPERVLSNIPSTSLQLININQLDEIQSNLMTVKNISPLQDESQNQILHHATAAQDSHIDSTLVKIAPLPERVLSNIPSTSLQLININQLGEIQSNLMTVKNISPTQDESQNQILHHATTSQHLQIDCKSVKIAPLPERVLSNIPSTSLQLININQLGEIQSNLMTVKNISPIHDESQKQILHHATAAQDSQIHCKFVKIAPLTERAQYNVKGNFKPMTLTPREVINIKPNKKVKPVMNRTRKNLPENTKEWWEFFRRSAAYSNPPHIKITKVTQSELNDFLEQARNNETYLASPFKCEICILGFKEERFLQRHMLKYRHATISKSEFVCNVCLSCLPSEQELNTHQSIHDCLYSCTRKDFTSVLPLNVYHHYFDKHTMKKKNKKSLKLNPQVNQRMKPQAQNCETSARTSAKKEKRKAKLRKPKEIRAIKYEVFKPTIEDFDCMRKRVLLRQGGLQCVDCFQPLYGNDKLEEHRQLCHSESAGAHVCDMCKMRFTTAELLREHRPVHDKWYKCKADPACLYVAQKLSTMQTHITTKHRTKPIMRTRPSVSHECNICKKVFMTTHTLRTHMLIHNKQYMCEVCGHIAASSYNLYKHREVHFTGERDYLVCEFCPKRYASNKGLRYHRSQHLQVKPYACKLCDEKFYCPNTRGIHVKKVHEKKQKINKIYKCNVCHMRFPNDWTLTTHRSKHKELQRYKCDKCPKTFFMFNYLVSHQESHAYICECDICGKVFANRDTLKYHLNSKHSRGTEIELVKREKQKESSECSKVFPDRDTLKHNLHSKHSAGTETQLVKREKLKECSECGKVFQSVKKWRDHMKTHLIFPEDTPELS